MLSFGQFSILQELCCSKGYSQYVGFEWQVNKRMYTFGADISKTHSKLVPRGIPYSQAPYVTIKKENIFETSPAAIMECFARNKTVN